MPANALDHDALLADALARYQGGFDPALIELTERAVFPHLIPVRPITGRRARTTGLLLGRPAPRFVQRGRAVRYRLKDVLDWLAEDPAYRSTDEATVAHLSTPKPETEARREWLS